MGIYMNSQFSDGDKVTREDSEGLGTGKQTGVLKVITWKTVGCQGQTKTKSRIKTVCWR